MIPFEEKPSLTVIEERAEQKLKSNWDFVVRTTPGIKEDFEKKWPELSKQIGKKIGREAGDPSNIFRPGIPDFLAFNETAEYKFVEVKGEEDGLRHTQLRWIRDYHDLNVEVWFADSNQQIEDKMKADEISAYSLKQGMKNDGCKVIKSSEGLQVVLPETLASIMNLEPEDRVSWEIKNQSQLILDTD